MTNRLSTFVIRGYRVADNTDVTVTTRAYDQDDALDQAPTLRADVTATNPDGLPHGAGWRSLCAYPA